MSSEIGEGWKLPASLTGEKLGALSSLSLK